MMDSRFTLNLAANLSKDWGPPLGEADPGGREELFRYLSPSRIAGGVVPVAFIDRDRAEKAGRELPVPIGGSFQP